MDLLPINLITCKMHMQLFVTHHLLLQPALAPVPIWLGCVVSNKFKITFFFISKTLFPLFQHLPCLMCSIANKIWTSAIFKSLPLFLFTFYTESQFLVIGVVKQGAIFSSIVHKCPWTGHLITLTNSQCANLKFNFPPFFLHHSYKNKCCETNIKWLQEAFCRSKNLFPFVVWGSLHEKKKKEKQREHYVQRYSV